MKETDGIVMAVCISREKGTPKENIGQGLLIENWGLEHDAHAGKWHRQVSLLSADKIDEFKSEHPEVTIEMRYASWRILRLRQARRFVLSR